MTDEFTIPPVPVDAKMLPELLSAKLRSVAHKVAVGWVTFPDHRREMAMRLARFADEADALEARVRTGRTKP